jgi:hypothetical protein
MGQEEGDNVGTITGTLDGSDRRWRELEQFEAIIQTFPDPVPLTPRSERVPRSHRSDNWSSVGRRSSHSDDTRGTPATGGA